MKIMKAFLPLILIIFLSACYPSLTGTVVDSETGKPIEGAIVLAEWTKTKGLPGMPYTESYKVVEVLTDKKGKFKVSGIIILLLILLRSQFIKKAMFVGIAESYFQTIGIELILNGVRYMPLN